MEAPRSTQSARLMECGLLTESGERTEFGDMNGIPAAFVRRWHGYGYFSGR